MIISNGIDSNLIKGFSVQHGRYLTFQGKQDLIFEKSTLDDFLKSSIFASYNRTMPSSRTNIPWHHLSPDNDDYKIV